MDIKSGIAYVLLNLFFFFNVVFISNFSNEAAAFRYGVLLKVRNAAEGGWLDKHDEFDFAGSLHFKKIPLPDDIPAVKNRSAFSVEPIGESTQPAVFYMDGRKVFIPAKARSDFIDVTVDALLWGRAKHNLYWACAITFVVLSDDEMLSKTKEKV